MDYLVAILIGAAVGYFIVPKIVAKFKDEDV